jgi:hypothetical protein
VSENLQLAAIEIVALVFRERDDKENEVLRSDVLIDDAGAAPRAPTFGGSAQFTETAAAGNQVAQMRMRDEKHLQIQDVRFGQKTGDGFLKGRESDEFHRAMVRHWRSVSRGRERQLFQSEKSPLSWHRASGLRSSNFAQGWVGADDLSASRPEKTKELDQTLTAFLAQVKATTVQTKIGKDERGVRR